MTASRGSGCDEESWLGAGMGLLRSECGHRDTIGSWPSRLFRTDDVSARVHHAKREIMVQMFPRIDSSLSRRKHLLQYRQHFLGRFVVESPHLLDQPALLHGANLIEDDLAGFALEPAR